MSDTALPFAARARASSYDRALLAFLRAYALCVPLLYIRIGSGAYTFVDVAGPIALVFLATARFQRVNISYLFYIIYIFTAILSTLISPIATVGPTNTLLAARLFFISVPFWLALTLQSPDERDLQRVVKWMTFGCAIALSIGLALNALGIHIQDSQKLWVHGQGAIYRAGGLVGNSGAFGQTTAMMAVLLVACNSLKIRLPPFFVPVGWSMFALGLVTSSSRSAVLMVLAFFLVVLTFNARYIGRALLVALIAILIIGALFAAVSSTQQEFLLESLYRLDLLNISGNSTFTQSVRSQTWAYLVSEMGAIPLFGYGYKGFEKTLGQFVDNGFLLSWFEVGVLGTMMFLSAWISMSLRLLSDSLQRVSRFSYIGLGLLGAFLARMMTGGVQADWSNAPLVFLFLGLAMRDAQLQREARAYGAVRR